MDSALFLSLSLFSEMIKQLVSSIGIFAQKVKVFNGPLHFRYHAPSLHTGIRGGVVISESPIKLKFTDCTHREKMTVSIISW